jgi:hypothetical protein
VAKSVFAVAAKYLIAAGHSGPALLFDFDRAAKMIQQN